MAYTQPKEVKIKEKQDKFLRQQLEKEREQQLLEEIERNEKERVKKKGRQLIVSDLQKMLIKIANLGLKTLKQSGILDSYQYLLTSLCKYGLPTGDLYEFSALTVLRYEKKVKIQRKKELEERMKQRNDSKPVKIKVEENSPEREQSPPKKSKSLNI